MNVKEVSWSHLKIGDVAWLPGRGHVKKDSTSIGIVGLYKRILVEEDTTLWVDN